MRLTWVQPEDLLLHAFVQAHAEDVNVSDLEAQWFARTGSLTAPVSGAGAQPASDEDRAFARELLCAIAERSSLRPENRADEVFATAASEPTLPVHVDRNRIRGAWLGRAAGCLLGKPVEKIPRQGIKAILDGVGDWPLRRYFTEQGLDAQTVEAYPWNRRSRPTSLRENITRMPEDDDLNYPLLNLRLLEDHGDSFTTEDVAQSWLANLPAGRVFTAERVAYRNLLEGIDPDMAGSTNNPFKEWIGAWIRGDVFGWTHPGQPRKAARLAFTDARLSHVRAGVHGEMWVAAACAASVVVDTLDEVFEAAASVVPADSALLSAIEAGRAIAADRDLDRGLNRLHELFGGYHWVHVLNNAASVAWALASTTDDRGRPDYAQSICRSVMAGWDTDSSAATVGSIAGALAGVEGLPLEWVEPLRDTYDTSLPGFSNVTFTELAERTIALAQEVDRG